jgi:murein DD-endopeptidase MepM/ murein hydrolase activator NlpD
MVVVLTIVVVGTLGIWLLQRKYQTSLITVSTSNGPTVPTLSSLPLPTVSPSATAFTSSPQPTEEPTPAETPSPANALTPAETPGPPNALPQESFVGKLNLIIPVANVRSEQLLDTFSDARSEGRTHDAIDIPAPAGTPVLAAADGEIVKLFQSEKGGTTIYQASTDKRLIFYYAHLQGYAATLSVGQSVRQGDVIAYVGDTGNAGIGNFHLHFSIAVVADPRRYWEGTSINPYPLLHR